MAGVWGTKSPRSWRFFYKFGSHLSHFKCTKKFMGRTSQPPLINMNWGGRKSTPPGAFEKRKWEGRVDEVGGSNPPNPPCKSNPGYMYAPCPCIRQHALVLA